MFRKRFFWITIIVVLLLASGGGYYYYKNVDPNWKGRSEKEVEELIKTRYASAYSTKNLTPWIRGLAYFILDERNSGLLKTKLLNGWINKAKNTKNEGHSDE